MYSLNRKFIRACGPVVKRLPPPRHPLPSTVSILHPFSPRLQGAKYSSNLVTLPSVRRGLFIPGVSRLSFIVAALSFLPSFPSPRSSFYYPASSLLPPSSSFLDTIPTALGALTYSGLMPVVLPSSTPLPLIVEHLPHNYPSISTLTPPHSTLFNPASSHMAHPSGRDAKLLVVTEELRSGVLASGVSM